MALDRTSAIEQGGQSCGVVRCGRFHRFDEAGGEAERGREKDRKDAAGADRDQRGRRRGEERHWFGLGGVKPNSDQRGNVEESGGTRPDDCASLHRGPGGRASLFPEGARDSGQDCWAEFAGHFHECTFYGHVTRLRSRDCRGIDLRARRDGDIWRAGTAITARAAGVWGESFMDPAAAKRFLISKVIDEAAFEHISLTDIEKKMLQFSELHPSLPNLYEVNEEFERDYDADEYEDKIKSLLKNARERDGT